MILCAPLIPASLSHCCGVIVCLLLFQEYKVIAFSRLRITNLVLAQRKIQSIRSLKGSKLREKLLLSDLFHRIKAVFGTALQFISGTEQLRFASES
jgi:hypothetical protein